ncbi:MAG: NAD(P)H-dependent oxidoreductase [Bacteroidetes bacterium]|nr:NAD(P)H-dependent oxidoreductase [Bacteroidota bacterium]
MNIEIIAGSPRKPSLSLRVAKHLQTILNEKHGHHTGLINLQDTIFPFIQDVWKSADHAPVEFQPIAKRVFEAHAFIIVTPEYNGGYSPAISNFFDHFPKQLRKTFGIAATSPGALGGIRAAQNLLLFNAGLFGITSPQMLIVPQVDKKFDEQGQLMDENFKLSLDNFTAEFLWLAERVANAL